MGFVSSFQSFARSMGIIREEITPSEKVDLSHFCVHRLIGQGGFGNVYCVSKRTGKDNSKLYAMKKISYEGLVKKNGFDSLLKEKNILSCVNHPFICNLYYCFTDCAHCYLVIDLALGGDMRYYIQSKIKTGSGKRNKQMKKPMILEKDVKFYMRCVVLALKHLHERDIIHRDIKPENIIMDLDGYVMLTDFGLSDILINGSCNRKSGTKRYMAPEVINTDTKHSYGVDIFAVGIVIYEMITGELPFNRNDITGYIENEGFNVNKLIRSRLEYLNSFGVTSDLLQLLEDMLQFDPTKRLGSKVGAGELIEHPWFRFDFWDVLIKKQVKAPFLPDDDTLYVSDHVFYQDMLLQLSDLPMDAKPISIPKEIQNKLEYDHNNNNDCWGVEFGSSY